MFGLPNLEEDTIFYEPAEAGIAVTTAAERGLAIAKAQGRDILMVFNDTPIVIDPKFPGTDADVVVRAWNIVRNYMQSNPGVMILWLVKLELYRAKWRSGHGRADQAD